MGTKFFLVLAKIAGNRVLFQLNSDPMEVVLLVEDDDQVRVVVEYYLEELGHKVVSAGTPQEALALLNTAAQIDLLFTDVDLTGDREAGLKLARETLVPARVEYQFHNLILRPHIQSEHLEMSP